jgi:hypothetical protein
MEIIRGIPQGSQEWFDLRLGKVTGSKFKAVLTKGTKGAEYGATFLTYARELAEQLYIGEMKESYKSEAMQRGNDQEPNARNRYIIETGNMAEEVTGFDVSKNVFISPDSIIGTDGGLEIKNPNTATHLAYMKAGIVPKEYYPQVQGCIWGGERDWWDFMSYDDRLKYGQVFLIRTYRDDKVIKELTDRIDLLVKVRDDIVSELISLKDYDYRELYNKTLIQPNDFTKTA